MSRGFTWKWCGNVNHAQRGKAEWYWSSFPFPGITINNFHWKQVPRSSFMTGFPPFSMNVTSSYAPPAIPDGQKYTSCLQVCRGKRLSSVLCASYLVKIYPSASSASPGPCVPKAKTSPWLTLKTLRTWWEFGRCLLNEPTTDGHQSLPVLPFWDTWAWEWWVEENRVLSLDWATIIWTLPKHCSEHILLCNFAFFFFLARSFFLLPFSITNGGRENWLLTLLSVR